MCLFHIVDLFQAFVVLKMEILYTLYYKETTVFIQTSNNNKILFYLLYENTAFFVLSIFNLAQLYLN